MPDTPLYFHTIAELATLIQSQQVSPVEVTRVLLERITRLDGRYKSYATVMADSALETARAAERDIRAGTYRGPLHGVPVAVKDLCFTTGVRTMGGTRALADHVPNADATVVARLHAAGAILLGKLNLTEGAMGGYHPDFAIPVNRWHAERYAGASSSGSGVATAAGLCFGSLGSASTGGSSGFPAAACGIVGLKPTWGRVSRYGVLALAESLDHVGPMTRSTLDAAIMLQAIAGPDRTPHRPAGARASPGDRHRLGSARRAHWLRCAVRYAGCRPGASRCGCGWRTRSRKPGGYHRPCAVARSHAVSHRVADIVHGRS